MKKLASAFDPLWYKDAIIYELHVRAFADSNGDGIGDFPGLLSRLDYLQDLGVTCIWLLPFFPSPLHDDGYDIANYVDVNPSYGTLNDFKAVLDAAHQRNMQVMIELVINHTSDQHPWFKAARLAPPGSPERDMYVWSQTDQLYKDARIIFTDTEKSNWTWDETAHAYYWHRFFSHQPDLNFDNPAVLEEVLKAMRFWLDMGVDGLRMDAIPYLVERDATSCENLPETHAIIQRIRAAIDAEYGNRLILAEANQWPADVRPYFGEGDECHMAFHFPLMPRIYMALRQEDRLPITDIMAQTPPIPDNCQWGLFLRNHDELTLEMVTDDERDYMYFAYSADPRMRVNVGIRRRLAPLVDNNRRRIELLNSLLLSFPGTPILYYGDEIGMGDNIYLGDRNGVRTPMQWTSDRNAGFSKGDPARLYLPVIMDPIYGYQVVNAEAQLSDQSSLLHWTRNMIALRKLFQVFGRGTLTFLNPVNRKVLAYLRDLERSDGSHETVLCVANLSRFAQPVSLDLALYAGMEPVEMLGYVSFPTITESPYPLTLAPYSFLLLELQPARPKMEEPSESDLEIANEVAPDRTFAVELLTKGWQGWFAGHGFALLESWLPAWLPRQRWFGAKTREIRAVDVLDWIELPGANANSSPSVSAEDSPTARVVSPVLLFVEVDYSDDARDVYQVPVAVSVGAAADEIMAAQSAAVLTTFTSPSGPAVLHDATIREDTRQSLLALIKREASLPLSTARASAREIAAAAPPTVVDQRPSESSAAGDTARTVSDQLAEPPAEPSPHPLSSGTTVAPVAISAQPGEAAQEPRTSAPASSAGAQRLRPRESPYAGSAAAEAGRLDAHFSSAFTSTYSAEDLTARVGSAEQSNTSIIYGQKLILKLFRRLQPGENPDVEIGRFLTEVAHYSQIAPFLGEITITPAIGEKTTIAMLQCLVANQGDGWAWFLEQLGHFFAKVSRLPAPPEQPSPRFDEERPTDRKAEEYAAPALRAAALLGRRTAEMHLALATPTPDPAFTAEAFTADALAQDARRIESQVYSVFDVLKAKLSTFDEPTSDAVIQLLTRRHNLLSRARAIAISTAGGQRIRIHGDYHLGQTLRTNSPASSNAEDGDFVLLDFEGEPARSLAERRQKQSPLKDVAGMLRSFAYAAHAGLEEHLRAHTNSSKQGEQERLKVWEKFWQAIVSNAFISSYQKTIATDPRLLPPPQQAQLLLDAYVLEKALYELLYELNNRPTWLTIPLAGILAL